MWSVLLHRRDDWAFATPPPRLITEFVALASLVLSLYLLTQSNSAYRSPAYITMLRWGRDAGFHARPMAFWGVLYAFWAVTVFISVRLRMPVLAGAFMLGLAVTQAFYAGAVWGHIDGHSHTGPVVLGVLLFWWLINAGGLLSLRPAETWPRR